MITLKHVSDNVTPVMSVAIMMLYGSTALAQTATHTCRPAQVIPLTGTEPAAKIVIDAPLAEPLASRGVVVIQYCAENMRIAPVFGPGALAVSPRVGHIHVTVDKAPWHWADASGTPLILRGLPPGPHTVPIELVDANHQPVDKGTVTFEVPQKAADRRAFGAADVASAERECERLHAGIEELDLEGAIDDRPRLPYQLIQPLFANGAAAAVVHVQAVSRTWRLPVHRHAEAYRALLPRRPHHQVNVARVKATQNPATGSVQDRSLIRHVHSPARAHRLSSSRVGAA